MSQAKVEKHKQEKYNRKKAPKQSKIKKYLSYAGATLVAAVIIIYAGYSIAVETGFYKIPETTTAYVSAVTSEQLASTLSSSGDYLGFYNKALANASENSTEETTEEATTIAEERTEE